jgi:DNA-binding NarL/FixJ family response regulator
MALVASVSTPDALPAPIGGEPSAGEIDVVLLDLYLDGETAALDAVAVVARRWPVLVLSASSRRGDVLAALQRGASGYLTKDADEEGLAEAVRIVAAGGFFLSAQLADILQSELSPDARPGPAGRQILSAREREVLSYVARGFTHQQTATRMAVSLSTVDTYVSRIRRKLGIGNKAQLAIAALAELAQVDSRDR